jgi:hypothetical protein
VRVASAVGVTATVRTLVTAVRVSWAVSIGASSYDIFRAGTSNVADATLLASQTGQGFYEDRNAVPEVAYPYWVKARNVTGTSDFSLPATGIGVYVDTSPPIGAAFYRTTFP